MQPEQLSRSVPGTSPGVSVLRALAERIGTKRYEHWFSRQTRLTVRHDELVVTVPNPFLLKWLQQSFRQELEAAAQVGIGVQAQVRFEVVTSGWDSPTPQDGATTATGLADSDRVDQTVLLRLHAAEQSLLDSNTTAESAAPETMNSPAETALTQTSVTSNLTQESTTHATAVAVPAEIAPAAQPVSSGETLARTGRRFADLCDFVPGPCNEFALSAVRQICLSPLQEHQFSTLYLHGPVGVGKTHLIEGLHKQLRKQWTTLQVVSLTAETFTNQFTQALRDRKLPGFRQRFRSVDVLIVDEIDFLENKRGVQEEFLHTYQQLERMGKLVVVTGDRHPRLLTKTSEELRSRFVAGMVCRLDVPDLTTRQRIVRFKSSTAQVQFAPEVVDYLAERFKTTVRELEGAVHTLHAYQKLHGKKLSLTAARVALADLERDCTRIIKIPEIVQAICTMFGVTTQDLQSNERKKSLSQPRMLAMYLARKHTRAAYTEIGAFFGGRNHSTVMAAERKISETLSQSSTIQVATTTWRLHDLVDTLEQQLLVG